MEITAIFCNNFNFLTRSYVLNSMSQIALGFIAKSSGDTLKGHYFEDLATKYITSSLRQRISTLTDRGGKTANVLESRRKIGFFPLSFNFAEV